MNKEVESIGTIIRKARKNNDITQEQLAELTGTSVTSVSKWERDICIPSVRNLKVIAETFNISLTSLMNKANYTKEEQEESYSKQSNKKPLIKIVIYFIFILLIIAIISCSLILNNNNQNKVYLIKKENNALTFSGYLISTSGENIIIVSDFGFIDQNAGTSEEIIIDSFDVLITCESGTMYKKTYNFYEEQPLSEIISSVNINYNELKTRDLEIIKSPTNANNVKLVIKYTVDGKDREISSPLIIEEL